MKLAATGAHAHQLTRLGLMNCYLVRESDTFTLVDTTIGGAAQQIIADARTLGPEPIERILLTHAHGDHVGSVDETVRDLGGKVGVAIGAREARLLQKPPDRSLEPGEIQSKLKGSYPGIRTPPTHLLQDGELYGSLRVINTPGHTPGHCSYFDERDGTLYTGDALVCVGGEVHICGFGPWYFPLPSVATWHKPLAMNSAQKLLDMLGTDIRRYAAGHGRLVEGGPALLRQALEQAQEKVRETVR